MDNERSIGNSIRRAAMNALARREHSRTELERKLFPKFPDHGLLVSQQLDLLAEEGLQSDQRYIECHIRSRSRRGYGPARIANELGQKGIDEDELQGALVQADVDWLSMLKGQYSKKFGNEKPGTFEEKAKVQQFFLYRGFSHQQIKEFLAGQDD